MVEALLVSSNKHANCLILLFFHKLTWKDTFTTLSLNSLDDCKMLYSNVRFFFLNSQE